jgi:hypothetical protein
MFHYFREYRTYQTIRLIQKFLMNLSFRKFQKSLNFLMFHCYREILYQRCR